MDKHDAMRRI
jgi:hypothetical protein